MRRLYYISVYAQNIAAVYNIYITLLYLCTATSKQQLLVQNLTPAPV
jgi:hypothetical protein